MLFRSAFYLACCEARRSSYDTSQDTPSPRPDRPLRSPLPRALARSAPLARSSAVLDSPQPRSAAFVPPPRWASKPNRADPWCSTGRGWKPSLRVLGDVPRVCDSLRDLASYCRYRFRRPEHQPPLWLNTLSTSLVHIYSTASEIGSKRSRFSEELPHDPQLRERSLELAGPVETFTQVLF